MQVKLRLLVIDYELSRSISVLFTVPTSVYSRYFSNDDDEFSVDYDTLKSVLSPRQFSRVSPLYYSHVRHLSSGGFVVERKYFVRILKVSSI